MKHYWKANRATWNKVLAAAALLSLSGPGPAAAYVYFITSAGVRQHWESSAMPIPWSLNQGNNDNLSFSSLVTAFTQCFGAWDNLAQADFSFRYVGTTTLSQLSGSDNIDLLIFDSQPIPYNGGLFTVSENVSPSVVAVTINTYFVSSGNVADADIVFNDIKYTFTTTEKTDLAHQRINLQDVATHEIGHLLGMDHTFLEKGTMYPYARDGQSTLEADDIAGISNLYPTPLFQATTDSLYGRVKNKDGLPVWGIYVTAIKQDTGEESVAAITDSLGRYEIAGLAPSAGYYLNAQTVDLDRLLGLVKENGDRTVYIPQYYDQAYRLADARAVTPNSSFFGYDFSLGVATILARYDRNPDYPITVLHFGPTTSSSYYMAVRFPKESLPASFNVFGMTFYNNDASAAWPKILLTSGTDTQPDLTSYIRQTLNYQGTAQGSSSVEWELAPLTNSRVLWVVFQFPDKIFTAFGDGPAIGAESEGADLRDLFYSNDGGQSFTLYPTATYNLQVYLTAELSDVVPVPVAQFDASALKFGVVKIGTRKEIALPISNTGTGELVLSDFGGNKPFFFTLTADNPVIPAGDTGTLRAVFTPKGNFSYTGEVTFLTNDPTRTSINIPVSGQGVYPSSLVIPTTLDFGQVEVGSSAQKQFKVFSTGQVSLKVSRFTLNSSHFSGPADSTEIAAGDSAAFTVTFAPQSGGALTAALTFRADKPLDSLVSIALMGGADANNAVTLVGDSVLATIGTVFSIKVDLENPSKIVKGGQFVVTPGSNQYLSFKSVAAGSRIAGWTVSNNASGNGQLLLFFSASGAVIDTGNGELLKLSYELSSSTPEGVNIPILITGVQLSDENQQPLTTILINGNVTAVSSVCQMPGDVTLDGRVNITDIITIVIFALGKSSPSPQQYECADLNHDGVINVFDVLSAVNVVLGKSSLLSSTGNIDIDGLIRDLRSIGADESLEKDILELWASTGPHSRLPRAFALAQNYPNPFNPVTAISFSVPENAANTHISLRVYDIRGGLVRTLVDQSSQPGEHTVFWDGSADNGVAVPSGVYIYRLEAGPGAGKIFTRKMVLLK